MAITNVLIQGTFRQLEHANLNDFPGLSGLYFELKSDFPKTPFNPEEMHNKLLTDHNLENITKDYQPTSNGGIYVYANSFGRKDIQINPRPITQRIRIGIYGETYNHLKDIGSVATAASIFNTIVPIIGNSDNYSSDITNS